MSFGRPGISGGGGGGSPLDSSRSGSASRFDFAIEMNVFENNKNMEVEMGGLRGGYLEGYIGGGFGRNGGSSMVTLVGRGECGLFIYLEYFVIYYC